jgi:calcineurin-like phosphoesterase family protein
MIFVTADLHLNHCNIIKYCNRPFKTVEEMNKTLINNWNSKVTKEDVVFHLGDFCFGPYKEFERKLNGKIVYIKGNHDQNIKEAVYSSILNFNNHRILLIHNANHKFVQEFKDSVDVVFFGHVHNLCKTLRFLYPNKNGKSERNLLGINVGIDCWDFKPVRIDEVMKFYYQNRKIKKDI